MVRQTEKYDARRRSKVERVLSRESTKKKSIRNAVDAYRVIWRRTSSPRSSFVGRLIKILWVRSPRRRHENNDEAIGLPPFLLLLLVLLLPCTRRKGCHIAGTRVNHVPGKLVASRGFRLWANGQSDLVRFREIDLSFFFGGYVYTRICSGEPAYVYDRRYLRKYCDPVCRDTRSISGPPSWRHGPLGQYTIPAGSWVRGWVFSTFLFVRSFVYLFVRSSCKRDMDVRVTGIRQYLQFQWK